MNIPYLVQVITLFNLAVISGVLVYLIIDFIDALFGISIRVYRNLGIKMNDKDDLVDSRLIDDIRYYDNLSKIK